MRVRAPITFVAGNLVFGGGEVWAVYSIEMRAYGGLSDAEKIRVFAELSGLYQGLGRDFQLLRVGRPFDAAGYARQAEASADRNFAHHDQLDPYLAKQAEMLGRTGIVEPEVYLCVRVSEPPRSVLDFVRDPRGIRERIGGFFGGAPGISRARWAELRRDEAAVRASVGDYMPTCERATAEEIAWLCARGMSRAIGEPERSTDWLPQALLIEDGDEATLVPLERDCLRLLAHPIEVHARSVSIEHEEGISYQAALVLGALPERAEFPGRQAELLFRPLDEAAFSVDVSMWVRHIANADAMRLVRRRIVDADNAFSDESSGDHGPTSSSSVRPRAARELEDYLQSAERPPLLRATISLIVSAPSEMELDRRIEAVRATYSPVALHRPLGEQLALFLGHLPGRGAPVSDWEDYLLVEQAAAMVPHATNRVGTESGPYLGHTLGGSHHPVLFDSAAASASARPPSVLVVGAPGAGKTMLLQTLIWQAYLLGSRVVDIDPKGDHRLEGLPGLSRCLEVIELSGDPAYQGALDPLRICSEAVREDAASTFLHAILPQPVPAEWQTEIRRAVRQAAVEPESTCTQVIQILGEGNDVSREAGRALGIYAETGLARLGFADGAGSTPLTDEAQVTSIRIRNLPRVAAGTPRSELTEEERIGQAVFRLVAGFPLHLLSRDRGRHKLVTIDEAFVLLEDPAGRRLIEVLNRWSRSEFATPVLVTHLVRDAEEIDNLIGARFVMGMESEDEAGRALRLLHLDPEDEERRRRLVSFRKGRCYLRDWLGRVSEMQVDVGADLEAALDTTPTRG